MDRWKKLLNILLFPHPALIFLLVPIAASLLVYSFAVAQPTDRLSIAAYTLSFYALVVVILRTPDILNFMLRFRKNNKYVIRYTTDVRLRINISLFRAFFFNAAYAMFQLCLGVYHASVWFYALASYYLFLAAMRLILVRHTRIYGPGENQLAELKKYRTCGVCLLLMNLALSAIIFYIVWQNRTFRHHEITTIAMAAYTFTSLTIAIVNVIRYRRYQSPVYSAAKIISLASAAVSMLTLEAAMLTAFSEENGELFRQIMLGVTGTVVVMLIQGMALRMIINASRKLKLNTSQTKRNNLRNKNIV